MKKPNALIQTLLSHSGTLDVFSQFKYFLKHRPRPAQLCIARSLAMSGNQGCQASQSSSPPSTLLPELTQKYPELKSHKDIYDFSIKQPNEFWSILAKSNLKWQEEFTTGHQYDSQERISRWFPDGKINVAENCVDRHAASHPNRIALIWEKDEPGQQETVSYRELKDLVGKMGNVLLDSGVKKGDRVAIYLPVMPIAVAAMLACARIGAIHSVVFAGFSAEALASRITNAGAETVITADQAVRGGKTINLKKTVDEAVARCSNVKRVFVATRTGSQRHMNKMDIDLDQALQNSSPDCPIATQSADDILFLLYTSGSTGKPKGIAHATGGYILYASTTHKHAFDYKDGDIYGCVADIGWITGHSYVVYGPLANGATTVLFESTPTYPDPGRYWETASRLNMTHFYCAPTALRLLLRYGNSWPSEFDLSSLRILGSVGEPLNHEAWHWFNDVVGQGRCSLVDTWWQTETGGIMISPRPSSEGADIIPGMPMRPMYGIKPVLIDSSGKTIESVKGDGALCIETSWPGMARTIYGDHKRFLETYFHPYPGYYFTGDGALRTEDGHYQITGRMDDIINVTGHRLGTAEVEDAMDEHVAVSEAAVVGFPHDIKGEGIYAFVVLKEKVETSPEDIVKELKSTVRSQIAGYAVPEFITIVPGLPKTRSGKIMRRILRKIAANQIDELGDISTLADPSVVDQIVKLRNNENKD